MIVDTSAVVAILFAESDAARYERAISMAWPRRMSVVALLETTMVIEGRSGPDAGDDLDLFLREADIELEPVTLEQVEAARRAWRRFGKGHHPAALNFGDCFAYALASTKREPLLFKGGDFARTDVEAA